MERPGEMMKRLGPSAVLHGAASFVAGMENGILRLCDNPEMEEEARLIAAEAKAIAVALMGLYDRLRVLEGVIDPLVFIDQEKEKN